jgi:hypothetical protein
MLSGYPRYTVACSYPSRGQPENLGNQKQPILCVIRQTTSKQLKTKLNQSKLKI